MQTHETGKIRHKQVCRKCRRQCHPQKPAHALVTPDLTPIRLTAELLPHLRSIDEAAIVIVSSGLAFVPLASASACSASKAAIHSWSISMRHELRSTNIAVAEIVPRWLPRN